MITVHDRDLCGEFFDQLIEENPERLAGKSPERNTKPATANSSTGRAGSGISAAGRLPTRSRTSSSRGSSAVRRTKEWLSMKSRRNIMLLPPDPELELVREQCLTISEREKALLQDLDTLLTAQSAQYQHKKEMLYKQWSERVFDPLQKALRDNMDTNGAVMDTHRREIFDQYLSTVNKKDEFLDITGTTEYKPLSFISQAIPARMKTPLNDPLVAQHVDHATEQQVITGCDRGVATSQPDSGAGLQQYGRQDTDPVLWLAMQLVQIDSDTRKRAQKRLRCSRNESHISQDIANLKQGPQRTTKFRVEKTI